REAEREVGEAEDPVQGELEQLGERHARPAGRALRAVVRDLDLTEAHPVSEAGQVPRALGHGQHRVERRAIDEREVAGAEGRGGAGGGGGGVEGEGGPRGRGPAARAARSGWAWG